MTTSDLFLDILGADDRDRCPGARAVLSFRDDDDPRFLREIDRLAHRRVALRRRGAWHGNLAVLGVEGVARPEALAGRWRACRPVVLPGALGRGIEPGSAEESLAFAPYRALRRGAGLAGWLEGLGDELDPPFRLLPDAPELADPERDLARVGVAWGEEVDDLWIKAARLSTHPADESTRVRVAFGREGDDDASPDRLRLRLVHELAERVLPGCARVHAADELRGQLEGLAGVPLLFTQHIAYWNAPEGGALFHHDAFDEAEDERQLGVLYVQLAGCTAWLALSIGDLAGRVREFAENLDGGDFPWIEEAVFADRLSWNNLGRLLRRDDRLVRELGLPGCGRLAQLVNQGPEFTGLLADAGHAWVLEPGDAIVLPNAGLRRTAMHSVFCASDAPTYGLSIALRRR